MGKLLEKSLHFVNNWKENNNVFNENFKISVIIPTFKDFYLKKVLNHLSGLENIYEVIIVYDGTTLSDKSIINSYNFNLIILKHKKNYNAASSRNTGASFATGDILLFLDSDMILSPNFISKISNLLKSNENKALLVGFRDTLDSYQIPYINKWKEANYNNDWRISTTTNENFLDLTITNCGSINNNCNVNENINILKATNGFRTLGIKKEYTIGFWDLPCMVISHTLAIPKNIFFKLGGFPELCKGWGGEDIAFGFLATAFHLPIIPVLVGSYHIKHEPLSGTEEKKWNEMRENLKKYKDWAYKLDEFPKIDIDNCQKRCTIIYKSFDNKEEIYAKHL